MSAPSTAASLQTHDPAQPNSDEPNSKVARINANKKSEENLIYLRQNEMEFTLPFCIMFPLENL